MADSPYQLRASAAGTWVNCKGSVRMAAQYPEEDGPEAQEGTAAHWVATELVQGRAYAAGNIAPNGIVVTDEMVEHAQLFADEVAKRIPPENLLVETTLPATDIHPANGGTPDAGGIGHEAYVIHVVDYKYGHGFVDAYENWQCIDYLSMLFSFYQLLDVFPPSAEQHLTVEITIVQPRNYHSGGPVRSWRVKLSDLRAHFNILRAAAQLAMGPDPQLTVGSWCEHCSARFACPALQQAGYRAMAVAGTAVPFELSAVALSQELKWLKNLRDLMDARISGLEVQATALLRRGERLPHYSLEQSTARLSWLEGKTEEITAIAEALGLDLKQPPKLITPTQAKALAKSRGIDEAVINEYAHRPRGEMKLVELDPNVTRRIFGESKTHG